MRTRWLTYRDYSIEVNRVPGYPGHSTWTVFDASGKIKEQNVTNVGMDAAEDEARKHVDELAGPAA